MMKPTVHVVIDYDHEVFGVFSSYDAAIVAVQQSLEEEGLSREDVEFHFQEFGIFEFKVED